MGKGWPFRKTNHDHDAGSSRGEKKGARSTLHPGGLSAPALQGEQFGALARCELAGRTVGFSTPAVCWFL
jgi:hypothetical protein